MTQSKPHIARAWLLILQDSPVRYYDASGRGQFETDGSTQPWSTEWMASEAIHSVENIGDKTIEAIRIELKKVLNQIGAVLRLSAVRSNAVFMDGV
ncbi:MAG: hypothetical protein AAF921_06310 [Cyanobacteria bacterium P01_D01_bin.44]